MKKSMISLTLLLSLLATTGCSESAKAQKNDSGNDVMFTYDKDTYVTADDVYANLLDTTSGSKALFDSVYKKVIESLVEEDSDKKEEIEKEVEEEMVTWLQDAKDQASDNGVSKDTMVDALLEEEGVDSTDELTEKKIYEKQKEYVEDDYFDNNRNSNLNLVKEYVENYSPIHVKGILVKVADTSNTYFARSITDAETKKLARTTKALMNGSEFNILAMDNTFSDHSSSQISTGGDLGIMDVTTSFNNEYKLGIYTYFAYATNSAKAGKLLYGDDAELKAEYDALYANGFNVITAEQVANLEGSAELKKYANGELVNSNAADGSHKSLNLPRNVIYNNYFNSHRVSFLAADASAQYKTTVGSDEVVANKYGYPILVLTDENGVQFISIEMDSFETNIDAAVKYFGAVEGNKLDSVTVNGTTYTGDTAITPYFAQAGNSNKNSRKETVDTQINSYINKAYNSSISANQDFYYFRIYNEFIGNVPGATLDTERLTTLYGANYNESKYYKQVTDYIAAIENYRSILISDACEDTGEAFSKTLKLQDSYFAAGWVRPIWLGYYDGFTVGGQTISAAADFETANRDSVPSEYKSWVDYWNKNLGGGALYA